MRGQSAWRRLWSGRVRVRRWMWRWSWMIVMRLHRRHRSSDSLGAVVAAAAVGVDDGSEVHGGVFAVLCDATRRRLCSPAPSANSIRPITQEPRRRAPHLALVVFAPCGAPLPGAAVAAEGGLWRSAQTEGRVGARATTTTTTRNPEEGWRTRGQADGRTRRRADADPRGVIMISN